MVIKQDSKKEIFSEFNIDTKKVRSNEQALEDAMNAENDKSVNSSLVDNNIFADFKLDEYVKESQQKVAHAARTLTAAAGAKVSNKNGDRPLYRYSLKGRVKVPSFLKKKSKDEDENGGDGEDEQHHDHDHADEDHSDLHQETKTSKSNHKSSKSNRFSMRSSAGTIPEDAAMEYHHEEYDDAEEIFGSDALDRDHNTKEHEDEGLNWTSVHASDSIFNDFDLDSIVKDYEKLQRTVNFKPGTHGSATEAAAYGRNGGANDDDDEEDDDDGANFFDHIGVLGIGVRYHHLELYWLDNFPRTHGLVARVMLPLFMIVCLSIGLGIGLAKMEIGGEIEANDEAMRSQYELIQYPYDETLQFLFNLPTVCFDYYVYKKEGASNVVFDEKNQQPRSSNDTRFLQDSNLTDVIDFLDGGNNTTNEDGAKFMYAAVAAEAMGYDPVVFTSTSTNGYGDGTTTDMVNTPQGVAANLSLWVGDKFPPVAPGFSQDPQDTVKEIKDYLQVCEDAGAELIKGFIDITTEKIQGTDGMSFNWMRCWNTSDPNLGSVNPFKATEMQLQAAGDQAEFYTTMWLNDQKALYQQYIIEADCQSLTCRKNAHTKSVAKATGAGMCSINKGATAWFWVVFLTTVGYGNQSPTTFDGRLFVGSIGWFLIIVWAIILYVSGSVLGIIVDDFLRRLHLRKFTGDKLGVFVWGFFALGWMAMIGTFAFYWFNYATHPGEWDIHDFWKNDNEVNELYMHIGASYWFAYISLLTVGLGDFFLEPEYMMYFDLFLWSFFFLIGFTFLSTWLGQVADLVNSLFPDCGDTLRERLTNTNLVGHQEVQYKKENEIGIQKLEQLVEMMDDDDHEVVSQRVTRIRVKKYVLAHLLYQTKKELDYYKHRGEKYENLSFEKVCEEENMLNECLAITVREREKIETYRDGRTTDVTMTENPTKKKVSISTLDDDGKLVANSADELESKLSIRSLKKKWDKKGIMKSSLYL